MNNTNANESNGEPLLYYNQHESTVTECLGGNWRLFVGSQIVFPVDTITWNADSSDLLFGLPEDFKKYFNTEGQFEKTDDSRPWKYKEQEEMYDSKTYIQFIGKGDSLDLNIKEDCFSTNEELAQVDKIRIVYDIIILDVKDFVKGNSSPKMIVQRPYRT